MFFRRKKDRSGSVAVGDELVPRSTLQEWGAALDAWRTGHEPGTSTADELGDVLAAWADTLRTAGNERGWQGADRDLLADALTTLGLELVPPALERAAQLRTGRLAVALMRLLMEAPDDGSLEMPLRGIRGAIVLTTLQGDVARRTVDRWAAEQGITIPRTHYQFLTQVEPASAPSPSATQSDDEVAGLFDGADATLLAESVAISDRLLTGLRRIIEARVDRFLVEVSVDDEPISYIQCLWESDRELHMELAHGTLLGRPTPPDDLVDLRALGWEDPDDEIPNHWQVVDIEDRSAAALAALLVRSMGLAHRAFHDLPEQAVLSVQPPAAAELVFEDDDVLHEIDPEGDGQRMRVVDPDIVPSGCAPVDVVATWARHVSDRAANVDGTDEARVDDVLMALRAAATAGRELRRGEGASLEESDVGTFDRVITLLDAVEQARALER